MTLLRNPYFVVPAIAWALQNGERYGVWGGTTEQTRRRLIRQVA